MGKKIKFTKIDFMGSVKAEDIIIPVMGKTGAGKSSFINTIPCDKKMEVGHSLFSCTQDIQVAIVKPSLFEPELQGRLKRHRVVLVDTPGFGDTNRSDLDILHQISDWLASSYDQHTKLAGIIYLHSMDEARMSRASRQNLAMFEKLCGDDALKAVILGTTKWRGGEGPEDIEVRREGELKEYFWKDLIQHQAEVVRLRNNEDSKAMLSKIVSRFLEENLHKFAIRIQTELVDKVKDIPNTAAGKRLREFLKEDMEEARRRAKSNPRTGEEYFSKLQRIKADFDQLRQLPWYRKLFG